MDLAGIVPTDKCTLNSGEYKIYKKQLPCGVVRKSRRSELVDWTIDVYGSHAHVKYLTIETATTLIYIYIHTLVSKTTNKGVYLPLPRRRSKIVAESTDAR